MWSRPSFVRVAPGGARRARQWSWCLQAALLLSKGRVCHPTAVSAYSAAHHRALLGGKALLQPLGSIPDTQLAAFSTRKSITALDLSICRLGAAPAELSRHRHAAHPRVVPPRCWASGPLQKQACCLPMEHTDTGRRRCHHPVPWPGALRRRLHTCTLARLHGVPPCGQRWPSAALRGMTAQNTQELRQSCGIHYLTAVHRRIHPAKQQHHLHAVALRNEDERQTEAHRHSRGDRCMCAVSGSGSWRGHR